jgi:uncharacterized membrane protein (DUF373 family)
MEFLLFLLGLAALLVYRALRKQLEALEKTVRRQAQEQERLATEVERLRQVLAPSGPPAAPVAAISAPATAPPLAAPVPVPPAPSTPKPAPSPAPAELLAPAAITAAGPAVTPPLPTPTPQPAPVPAEPAGPTWWERTAALLLENWTGILGAVILVTGVGFLGIYAALRVSAFARFWLISGGAAALLGLRWGLRRQAFAVQLSDWLQSSAAAIFLFACVGATSLPGLQWASGPLAYALLLGGVAANLWLAWTAGREAVASLHAVLSLVALAVLPPSLLTLGAAASVTVFSVFVTYRQLWRFQLLLSIVSFFAFHLYWHAQRPTLGLADNLMALGLVLLVGVAGGLVQYRRIYAQRGFEPVLFTAHLLNWSCLGINLYLHSTGSVWKTVPLLLGAMGTFWAGRRARQLGLEWLFRTDSIISLILALAAAFSLLAWQATPAVVLLFMLLETLLVTHVMARENEPLVFRVALGGGLLAGIGLLVVASAQTPMLPAAALYRLAAVLALAGTAGVAFCRLTAAIVPDALRGSWQARDEAAFPVFAGLSVALVASVSLVLTVVLQSRPQPPVPGLEVALLTAGGLAGGLAAWLGRAFVLRWLRPALLAAGQLGLGLACLGLHKAGLSWAGCWLLLYLESLAFQQFLHYRRETLARLHLAILLMLGLLLLPIILAEPTLSSAIRAALLLGAATATVLGQVLRQRGELTPSATPGGLETGFGWLAGALLLLAGSMQYNHTAWIAPAALAVGLVFLLGQWRWRVPGLVVGLLGALVGFTGLQWWHMEHGSGASQLGLVLRYLLPVAGLPVVALWTCFSPTRQQFVRQPWLYVLGAQLAGMVWLATTSGAVVVLGWVALAGAAFGAAHYLRRSLTAGFPASAALTEALRYHGQPDRYLLHLGYGLLLLALLLHLSGVLPHNGLLAGYPARYFSAAGLLLGLGGLALFRPPASGPVYGSWQRLQPWLLEATLGLATITVMHEVRAAWQPLVAITVALLAEAFGPRLPARLSRLWAYGRLLYGLAAGGTAIVCLTYLSPGQILSPAWWAATTATLALFGYVVLALRAATKPAEPALPSWPPGLELLAAILLPSFPVLVVGLLYPAFGVLALLLVQSFDKSLLTVLLMLEVFGIFTASLTLRRADLRYTALLGMAACLVRLVFFDLRQSHTLARAVVFIFMGLLLLGMNALYARFRNRTTPQPATTPAEESQTPE